MMDKRSSRNTGVKVKSTCEKALNGQERWMLEAEEGLV